MEGRHVGLDFYDLLIEAPNNPRSVTVVMDLGFKSNPNMHRAPEVAHLECG